MSVKGRRFTPRFKAEESRQRLLALQEPFDSPGKAATALRVHETEQRRERNADDALRAAAGPQRAENCLHIPMAA